MRRICAFLLLLLAPALAVAAPTQFTSPNYAVESIIFGGTGVLQSSSGSVPPQITSGPTVSNIQTTGVTVQWTTDKQSSSVVRVGVVTGTYTTEYGQIDQPTFTSHTVQLTQLQKGTTYFYKIRSSDVAGNVTESAESTFKTDPGDITAPVVTQGPSIAQPSATSIIVTWQTDEISNTQVDYGLQTVTENSAGNSDELTTFHQVQINGLVSNQSYLLRIKSKDTSGNQYIGPNQTVRTPSSPSITNVQITDITLNSALIQWQTSTAATSVINYGSVSGLEDQTVSDQSVSQNHLVRLSNLGTGTTYYLKIAGTDASGNRLQSDEYIFRTVVLPQIVGFTVSAVSSDAAHLSWTSSSDIDELVTYIVLKDPDAPANVGKILTAGKAQLVASHAYDLKDLDDNADYSVQTVGKDVFGNQAVSPVLTFHTPIDKTPPQILNIKTNTTVDLGSTQTVQVLVSYGLSKPGVSVIEYGEGASGKYPQQVTLDQSYTTNKFQVIPELVPGQSYHFHIVATDKHGNSTTSADYLVLAPVQPVSLLDLIFGQIRLNFGWLNGGNK